jgi:hypothetical protein
MKYLRHLALATTIATIATSWLAPPADRSDDREVDEVAAAVNEAASEDVVATNLEVVRDGLIGQLNPGGESLVATDPLEGLRVTADDGTESWSLSLPGATRLDDAAIADDGSVTYLGDVSTPAVNVLAGADAIRVSAVIGSRAQTERFDYDFGADVNVEVQPDGGAIVYVVEATSNPLTGMSASMEKIVAHIDPPWARDANGIPVRTHYEASGSVLTQVVLHVAHRYTYPIVADPKIDQPNIFQFRVRFNRKETATIAESGAGIIASLGCGIMLPVCVLAGGSIWWNASIAQKSKPKRCVQITATQPFVVPSLVWWVDTYKGGYCK